MTQSSTLGAVPTGSGFSVRTAINEGMQALVTKSAGESPPAAVYPNQFWYKPSARILYRRDDANTTWIIDTNYGSDVAPTTDADSSQGYVCGSLWVTGTSVYICKDPTQFSATWIEITTSASGVSSFNNRSGEVAPNYGDYTADMITDTGSKVIMTTTERGKLQGVATGADVNATLATLAEARAGSSTSARSFTPALLSAIQFSSSVRASFRVPFRSFFVPSYATNDFAQASNGSELDALVAQIPSCNSVCATVQVFSGGTTSNTVSLDGTRSEVAANLSSWFATAKSKGLRVGLAIVLSTDTSYGWGGNWNPASASTALANYATAIGPYLAQAEAAGADFLILCHEWSTLFQSSAALAAFQSLFATARAAFSGLIGVQVNRLEEDTLLGGIAALCDFIGVSAYVSLTSVNSPPVVDMVSNLIRASTVSAVSSFVSGKATAWARTDNIKGYFQYLRHLSNVWNKPLFLSVGYKSTVGAAINPATQTETSADNAIQETAHRAFIEAAMSVLGTGLIGFNLWRWWPKTTTDTTGYSVKGKSAAAAINAAWALQFTSFWGAGDVVLGVSGGGSGATVLDELGDVVIDGASSGQVLKYNGTIWQNATPTTGGSTWPPANWPSTGAVQLFWGATYGISPNASAATNDAAFDALFADVLLSTAAVKKVIIPGGRIAITASVSPSGKTAGLGSDVGTGVEFFFDNTTLLVSTGTVTNFMEVLGYSGSDYATFDTIASTGGVDSPIGKGVNPEAVTGTYILDASANGVRKWVVFNVRNCYRARITGCLRIVREGSRIANLVAIGSSGGGYSNAGIKGGYIADLTITNFETGIWSCRHNGATILQEAFHDTHIGRLSFTGGRWMVADGNSINGMNISSLDVEADSTAYTYFCTAINIGAARLWSTAASAANKKLWELGKVDVNIGALSARTVQLNGGHSAINVGWRAALVVGCVNSQQTNASNAFGSGGIIACHTSDSTKIAGDGMVVVRGAWNLEQTPTGALVSLQADSPNVGSTRIIDIVSFNGTGTTWKSVIPWKDAAASWATGANNDRIRCLDQNGPRILRIQNGNLISW